MGLRKSSSAGLESSAVEGQVHVGTDHPIVALLLIHSLLGTTFHVQRSGHIASEAVTKGQAFSREQHKCRHLEAYLEHAIGLIVEAQTRRGWGVLVPSTLVGKRWPHPTEREQQAVRGRRMDGERES